MAILERAVIARSPDQVPRLSRFENEVARPCRLEAGQLVGDVEILGWDMDGDHLRMDVRFSAEAEPFAVLLRARDPQAAAFLRTQRWNLSYRGCVFDQRTEKLLKEVAQRVDAIAVELELDPSELHKRYLRRPTKDEYLEITSGKKLYLRVTDHCDENCVFCNATEGNSNIISSKRTLREVLDGLPAGSLNSVIFSGGEPTLVKALPEYVALAHQRGAREIIVQTNGVLLAAPGALDPYLPYRDRLGIGFSLHAIDFAVSDRLTGAHNVPKMPLQQRFEQGLDEVALSGDELEPGPDTGRYNAKLVAIDRAVELGFRVKITVVVMRPNLDQVPRMAQWAWDRYGPRLERLQFSYAMPRGNAWLNPKSALSFTDCVAPFSQAFELGRRTGMRVETSQSACVPPCVMPDYLDHYDLYGDYSGGRTADNERVKPQEVCSGCHFDRVCAGVWQRYLERFGTDELQTITEIPVPDIPIDDYLEAEVFDLGTGAGDLS